MEKELPNFKVQYHVKYETHNYGVDCEMFCSSPSFSLCVYNML